MKTEIKKNLKISIWGPQNESLRITDMTNAYKRGKEVESILIRFKDAGHLYDMTHAQALKLADVQDFESALVFARQCKDFSSDVELYFEKKKAVRVAPENDWSRVKPLKEKPKKMTLTHIIRAIVNGQYDFLKCSGKYTDDYAWDNAVNFGRGEIADYLKFAKELIESPSGWNVWEASYKGESVYSVNCHSFDCNEVKLNLKKGA